MRACITMTAAALAVAAALAGCIAGEKTPDSQAQQAVRAAETGQTEGEAAKAESESQSSGGTTLVVAAAASLKNAFEEELIPMYQDSHPGVTVKGTYDSSGKLQTQIEEGLEADVFLSAAVKQMDALDGKGLIDSGTVVNLLENKIVLIVPAGGGHGFEKFEDIERAKSIALGDPASVPAGQYAEEALTSLGIWDKIQEKVSLGSNVTEVLNQVAEASADAGIVYATDAAGMADRVDVIGEAPAGSLSAPVVYPAAVVKRTVHGDQAKEFVEFLKTDEAMQVFEKYGFARGR